MNKIILFSLSLLLLSSCNQRQNNIGYDSEYLNTISLVKVKSIKFAETKNFVLGTINDAVIWNNKFIISDGMTKIIWIFDNEYHLIKKMGGRGRGPGEYLSPPDLVLNKNKLLIVDYSNKKIDIIDKKFNLVATKSFPKELIIQPFGWTSCGNFYVLTGAKPIASKKMNELGSVLILDNNFKFKSNIFKWDDIYRTNAVFPIYNPFVRYVAGLNGSLFAVQGAMPNKIHLFDNNFNLIKIFGREPKYFKIPPDVNLNNVMSSIEATAKYVSKISRINKLFYDKKNNYLISSYANYSENASYNHSNLSGQHYIQIFNKDFNCIYDGKIDGPLLFIDNGLLYVLISEKPNSLIINSYKTVLTR